MQAAKLWYYMWTSGNYYFYKYNQVRKNNYTETDI